MVGSSVLGHHKKRHQMVVVFRNLFDEFLKLRYNFYADITNGVFAERPKDKVNVGLPGIDGQDDDMNVRVGEAD